MSRVITEPTAPAKRRFKKRHLIEFIKFGVVGGTGSLVNVAVAIIMNKANGGTQHAQDVLFNLAGTRWNFRFTSLVWIVGFVVANVTNFQLNRSWTFKREHRRGWWREFFPFFAVGSVAAIIGMFVKILFTNPTSPIYLPEPWFHEERGLQSREYWSQIFAIIVTMPINFIVNKLWTFRAVKRSSGLPMVATAVAPERPDDDVAGSR
ncbi:GtrA family protein [Cutibacterium sp. WCA-380-WT-3A]|uniref:GtrA family protein n=1 Tax=Cutibacterium porci TaxID=2605781 RepID=A0A7K0J9B2_9ACTN|nr:GtrA family protein [Cutibacterium porci]MSS46450.1 GtrA family protein [Cutibacterium porci]